jgi:hypothetical protein
MSALDFVEKHLDMAFRIVSNFSDIPGFCDTICAIVGGIVARRTGREGIPADRPASRRPLDLAHSRNIR